MQYNMKKNHEEYTHTNIYVCMYICIYVRIYIKFIFFPIVSVVEIYLNI